MSDFTIILAWGITYFTAFCIIACMAWVVGACVYYAYKIVGLILPSRKVISEEYQMAAIARVYAREQGIAWAEGEWYHPCPKCNSVAPSCPCDYEDCY